MSEIEAIVNEVRRLENGVLRAAVAKYYSSPTSRDADIQSLDSALKSAVDALVAGLPAVSWVKRDGS